MKIIRDIIGKQAKKKWRVASKSKIGVFYEVSILGDNYYKCTCFASKSGKECSHIIFIRTWNKK